MSLHDPFNATQSLPTPIGDLTVYRLGRLKELGLGDVDRLPYSIKVLLEAVLRNVDGFAVTEEHVKTVAQYDAKNPGDGRDPVQPRPRGAAGLHGRALRGRPRRPARAMKRLGGDVKKVNPLVPCDLVIDHSVQVDFFGSAQALAQNARARVRSATASATSS
jgi:aconitate hydratase